MSTSTGNRHPVHIGHLVMGLAFLCIVGAWALVESNAVRGTDIRWLLPIPWLVAGAAGLVAVSVSSLRKHGAAPAGAPDADARHEGLEDTEGLEDIERTAGPHEPPIL